MWYATPERVATLRLRTTDAQATHLHSSVRHSSTCCLSSELQQSELVGHYPTSCCSFNISHNVTWQNAASEFPGAECITNIICAMKKKTFKTTDTYSSLTRTHGSKGNCSAMMLGAESGVPLLYPILSVSVMRQSNENSK